jgi:K+-transporting ATPase ATPase C chain
MLIHLRRAIVLSLLSMIVVGFAYAAAGTGVAQALFPFQANGSLTAHGSTLIGQNWSSPRWFHGRPDDTGPYATNTATGVVGGDNPLVANGVHGQSGATNLGPRSRTLLADTRALVRYWHHLGVSPTPDLVTTSGSGVDPDISPLDALVQIPMVARATGVAPSALRALIARHSHGPQFGFLGASYVDVLRLNEGLARLESRSTPRRGPSRTAS